MVKMKLFVVLLTIAITIKFSEEKPSATPETTITTKSFGDDESNSTTTDDPSVISESEITAKTISSTETEVKINSTEVYKPPENVELPVDLLSGDILLDPSVILARAERSTTDFNNVRRLSGPIENSIIIEKFHDQIPTFYFVKFIRIPRSTINPRLVPERIIEHFRMPEESEKTIRRVSRSAEEDKEAVNSRDLHEAEDGFIIRPYFRYRHEQLKRSNRQKYRNRDSYYYYPRYPVFPGK